MITVASQNSELNTYHSANGEPENIGNLATLTSEKQGKNEISILLDYDTYFDSNARIKAIDKIRACDKKIDGMYSPHEAIAGYIKSKNSKVEGDLQIVDVVSEYCYSFSINFTGGCYFWKDRSVDGKKKSINSIVEKNLKLSVSQLKEFELFLLHPKEGKTCGHIIREAIDKYKQGDKTLENIIAILDEPEWEHIHISNLVDFEMDLLQLAEIDSLKPYKILGPLGIIFSDNADVDKAGLEKVLGVMYIRKHSGQFYPKSETGIALEVYCYPNLYKISLYEQQSAYETYTTPRTIELIDTGTITIFRGDTPNRIQTDNLMKPVNLEICMDGNQNLVLNTGSAIYLVA